MNALDEVWDAIEKLTALAYSSSDGPWDAHVEPRGAGISAELFDANGGYVVDDGYVADVELIEVLHRTIDAQLAILSGAWGDADGSHDEPGAFASAVALARAINGADRTVTA